MTTHVSEYFVQQQLTGCQLVGSGNVAGVYFNGINNNGLGATITTSSPTLTLDSVPVNNNDSVLLTGQTSSFQNGIYVVSGVGSIVVLTRRPDFQSPSQMLPGFFVPIAAGSANAGAIFILVSPQVQQVGVSAITFVAATNDNTVQSVNLVNSGLNIYNPAETFLNHIVPTSAITAARQFSLVTGDQNTSLDLTAVPNFAPSAFGATLVSSPTKFQAQRNLGIKTALATGQNITLTNFSLSAPGVVATDIVLVNLLSSPNPAYIIGIGPGPDTIQLTFNTAPGSNSILDWVAYETV